MPSGWLPTRQQLENLRANARRDAMVAIMNGLQNPGDMEAAPYWQLLDGWDAKLRERGE